MMHCSRLPAKQDALQALHAASTLQCETKTGSCSAESVNNQYKDVACGTVHYLIIIVEQPQLQSSIKTNLYGIAP